MKRINIGVIAFTFIFCTYAFAVYDPNTGKWLSRDPLGELGAQNLYGFVNNDPINSTDRLGLSIWDWFKPKDPPKKPKCTTTWGDWKLASDGIVFTPPMGHSGRCNCKAEKSGTEVCDTGETCKCYKFVDKDWNIVGECQDHEQVQLPDGTVLPCNGFENLLKIQNAIGAKNFIGGTCPKITKKTVNKDKWMGQQGGVPDYEACKQICEAWVKTIKEDP